LAKILGQQANILGCRAKYTVLFFLIPFGPYISPESDFCLDFFTNPFSLSHPEYFEWCRPQATESYFVISPGNAFWAGSGKPPGELIPKGPGVSGGGRLVG
jgi:hypothetical protein